MSCHCRVNDRRHPFQFARKSDLVRTSKKNASGTAPPSGGESLTHRTDGLFYKLASDAKEGALTQERTIMIKNDVSEGKGGRLSRKECGSDTDNDNYGATDKRRERGLCRR